MDGGFHDAKLFFSHEPTFEILQLQMQQWCGGSTGLRRQICCFGIGVSRRLLALFYFSSLGLHMGSKGTSNSAQGGREWV